MITIQAELLDIAKSFMHCLPHFLQPPFAFSAPSKQKEIMCQKSAYTPCMVEKLPVGWEWISIEIENQLLVVHIQKKPQYITC